MYSSIEIFAIILVAIMMLGPLTAGNYAPDRRGNTMEDLQKKQEPRK